MNRFVISTLLFFSLFFLSLPAAGQQAGTNLLTNGEFRPEKGRNIAGGWQDNSGWADLTVDYSLVDQDNDGRAVQKIQCSELRSGAVQFVQQGVSIKKNRVYRLTLRLKGDIESPVEILLRKRGKPYTIYISKAFRVSNSWRVFSFVGTSPADDPKAYFMIRFMDTGSLYLAQAALEEVAADAPTIPATDKNIVANGSFEVGLDRWGVLIREAGSPALAMDVHFNNIKPKIINDGAADGNRYLEVDLPESSRLKITSAYVEAEPGTTCTLSCWLASDRPKKISVGLGSGYFQFGRKDARTFTCSEKWQKISFPVSIKPAPENLYYFILETTGMGVVKLDGISLCYGSQDDCKPGNNVETGFARRNQKTVFYPDDAVKIKLYTVNHSGAEAELKVCSVDFRGKKQFLLAEKIDAGREKEFRVILPSKKTGYFRLVAESRIRDQVQDSSQIGVAIVPRPASDSSLDSPFGGHVRFNGEMLDHARMLGVKWLRMHPPHGTKWFIVEREKGEFVFNDEPIRLAQKKGFHILGMLAASPRWASTAPEETAGEGAGGFRSYPPHDLKDWRNYVFQTVSHYKGVIDHWEVWNEPDSGNFLKIPNRLSFFNSKAEVYARLLKEAYTAAKKANPDAVIVGGGASHSPVTAWTEKIFRRDAGGYLDVLSYHLYTDGRPGDALPTPTGNHISGLYRLMEEYSIQPVKEIWETESGIMYPATCYTDIREVSPGYAVSGMEGALYLVRNYIHLLSHGVKKWFYYHLFVSRQADRREGAGFFEWDGSPRPLAIAHAVLAKTISGCEFTENVQIGEFARGAVFANKSRKVTVVWQKKLFPDKPFFLPVPDSGNVEIFDIMGNRLAPVEKNGVFTVPILGYPVYIVEAVHD